MTTTLQSGSALFARPILSSLTALLLAATDTTVVSARSLGCPPIVYVDASAAPGGNGESWELAYQDLQDALALARGCGGLVEEIWIAEGVYRPAPMDGDPDIRFELVDGATLYGGFPAGGAPFEGRDTDLYPTILSGELGDMDSRQVLRARDLFTGAVVDGVTIRDAWDDRRLAGGGGAEITNSTATFIDCDFLDNHAENGGAILIASSVVNLIACHLDDNDVYAQGGALKVENSDVIIADCTLNRNDADHEGGAVHADESQLTFQNCDLSDNIADGEGGAVSIDTSTLDIFDGILDRNSAGGYGGAIRSLMSDVLISGSALRDNSVFSIAAARGGAISAWRGGVVISDSELSGNSAYADGLWYNYGAGGAIHSSSSPLDVRSTTFRDNFAGSAEQEYAEAEGGAISIEGSDANQATIIGCEFISNEVASSDWGNGGALHGAYEVSVYTVINSLFIGNVATDGGAAIYGVTVDVTNCTFVANVAGDSRGVFYAYIDGSADNCIFWDNSPNAIDGGVTTTYCNLDGGWRPGEGNTIVSPQFVDPSGGDYRLAPGSRMIDAGDSAAVPSEITTDRAGLPRFHDDPSMPDSGAGVPPVVDIGAYEFQSDSAGHVFTIEVEPDPLVAGQPATITAVAGLPEAPAYIIRSIRGEALDYILELNVLADLLWPDRIGPPRNTNANGNVRWTLDVPRGGAGQTVWIQVVQEERKTNVIRREIR